MLKQVFILIDYDTREYNILVTVDNVFDAKNTNTLTNITCNGDHKISILRLFLSNSY